MGSASTKTRPEVQEPAKAKPKKKGIRITKRPKQCIRPAPDYITNLSSKCGVVTLETLDAVQMEANTARSLEQALEEDCTPKERIARIENALASRFLLQRYNMLHIGRLYSKVKRLLPQGGFGPWCRKMRREHGLPSQRTAENYMLVFEVCQGRPELVRAIPPTKLVYICSAKFPEKLRNRIFEAGRCNGTQPELIEVAMEFAQNPEQAEPRVRKIIGALEAGRLEGIFQEARTAARTAVWDCLDRLRGCLEANREILERRLERSIAEGDLDPDLIREFRQEIGAFKAFEDQLASGEFAITAKSQ